jgi:hypothetical protein
LVAALYGHFQATLHLIQVALMLEWTIFTRLFAFLVVLTFSYIFYILITLRHGRHPLMIWEKLGKPVVKLFRPWTFAKLVGSSDPYARSIGKYSLFYQMAISIYIFLNRYESIDVFTWFLYGCNESKLYWEHVVLYYNNL